MVTAGLCVWAGPVTAEKQEKVWPAQRERREGENAAQEVMAAMPPWDNPEQLARCQGLLDAIARHCDRPTVQYDIGAAEAPADGDTSTGGHVVRLVDDPMANAFALPGGFIFIARGLLEAAGDEDGYFTVQSDEELAGILAHEVAHVCHFHGLRQQARSKDLLRGSLAASLATLLLGGGITGAGTVFMFGQQFSAGLLNHYGVDYETEADLSAIDYLAEARINPNGLLTFMERLAAAQRSKPGVDPGIYQTHPFPVERMQAIRRAIRSHGIEINRRAVTRWDRPEAMEALIDGKEGANLVLWERTIHSFIVPDADGTSAKERATAAAEALGQALENGMAEYDITVEEGEGAAYVKAFDKRLFAVYQEEVGEGKTATEGAQSAIKQLRAALFAKAVEAKTRGANR